MALEGPSGNTGFGPLEDFSTVINILLQLRGARPLQKTEIRIRISREGRDPTLQKQKSGPDPKIPPKTGS